MANKKVDIERQGPKPLEGHADRGDTITWTNMRKSAVVLEIRNKVVFGDPQNEIIASGNSWTSPPVDKDCPDGKYSYRLSAKNKLSSVSTRSGPKIIVP